MAIIVGLALGLAGAEMQTILNNPLASPFTLGVSSAAAFGAALEIVPLPGIGAMMRIPSADKLNAISSSKFLILEIRTPVSYTHLDVYKRQTLAISL